MGGRLKATLLLLAVFGLGILAGTALDLGKPGRWGHGGGWSDRRTEKIKKELGLNDWQSKAFDDIVDDTRDRAEDQRVLMRLNWRSVRRDSMQAVKLMLTPEQQSRFERLHDRMRKRHGKRRDDDQPVAKPATLPTTALQHAADRQVDRSWKTVMEARRDYLTLLKASGAPEQVQAAKERLDAARNDWRRQMAQRRALRESLRHPAQSVH